MTENMFNNILFVCVGNICRSPVAEGLAKELLGMKSKRNISSCGIDALVGSSAEKFSIQVLQEINIDISSHKSRQITTEMALKSDLILTMEHEHTKDIQHLFPFTTGKVHLLGKWNQKEIIDPYRKKKPAFNTMLIDIDITLKGWMNRL
ncbi:MAG: protein-tyrosine phosphatase [Francisellaceae bacterium]|jgi:protein-tyrosine phosphatase